MYDHIYSDKYKESNSDSNLPTSVSCYMPHSLKNLRHTNAALTGTIQISEVVV